MMAVVAERVGAEGAGKEEPASLSQDVLDQALEKSIATPTVVIIQVKNY